VRAGKQAAQGCQQHPVLCAKPRPTVLSVEDFKLVTEDDDLDILVVDSLHWAGEQSEQRATDQITERDQLATSCSMGETDTLGEPAEERRRRDWSAQTGRL
jgi:hypothetical protein